jgi:hypothetical protein
MIGKNNVKRPYYVLQIIPQLMHNDLFVQEYCLSISNPISSPTYKRL